jgi:hypothetical protein
LRLGSAHPSNPRLILHMQGGPPAPIRAAPIVSAFFAEPDGGPPSRVPTKGGGLEERT